MSYILCISSHFSFTTFLWILLQCYRWGKQSTELRLRDHNLAFGLNFIWSTVLLQWLKIPGDVFVLDVFVSSLLLSLTLHCLIPYVLTHNRSASFRYLTLYYVVYLSAKDDRARKYLTCIWTLIWVTSKSILFTAVLYF